MADKKGTKRRLGRGLGSLISTPVEVETKPGSTTPPESAPADGAHDATAPSSATQTAGEAQESAPRRTPTAPPTPTGTAAGDPTAVVERLAINLIDPNRNQPRRDFNPDALAELAESIRAAGVMQPILVRRHPDQPGRYELIAGERRLRAAKLVPLERIPGIVQELDHRAAAEWALIENIQRDDLNPVERAEAFQSLIDQYGLTHQDIAERVGLNRSSVTNLLRLNELDRAIKDAIRTGQLSLGHAKVLLGVDDDDRRAAMASAVMGEGWSVRELERRIESGWPDASPDAAKQGGGNNGSASPSRETPAYLKDIEDRLGRHLGTRVRIKPGRKAGTGTLVLEFYTLDQFDGLMHTLGFEDDETLR